jgi:prepilin-type N-terminal cleavage/methylation domain-containing protein
LKQSWHQQNAFTLIELMISTAISGFVISMIYLFWTRVINNSNVDDFREWAKSTDHEIINIIRRDLRFYNSHVIPTGGQELQITRKQFYESNQPEATYDAIFSSYCAPISSISNPNVRQMMTLAYSGINNQIFSKTPNQCIKSLNCPADQFPTVGIRINPTGPRVPHYPIVTFPNISSKYKLVSAGTGICFKQIKSKIRVMSESAYFIDGFSGKLGITYEEALITTGSGTPIELLPTKN